MVRDYLRERVFERPVELDDKVILRRLAENDAQQLVVGAFQQAIRDAVDRGARADDRGERVPRLRHAGVPLVARDRRGASARSST